MKNKMIQAYPQTIAGIIVHTAKLDSQPKLDITGT